MDNSEKHAAINKAKEHGDAYRRLEGLTDVLKNSKNHRMMEYYMLLALSATFAYCALLYLCLQSKPPRDEVAPNSYFQRVLFLATEVGIDATKKTDPIIMRRDILTIYDIGSRSRPMFRTDLKV